MEVSEKKFFQMVKIGFSARRKMLKNNLSAGYRLGSDIIDNKLRSANIKINARPQDLSLDDWNNLFVNLD